MSPALTISRYKTKVDLPSHKLYSRYQTQFGNENKWEEVDLFQEGKGVRVNECRVEIG
jgi:hypothetical protein